MTTSIEKTSNGNNALYSIKIIDGVNNISFQITGEWEFAEFAVSLSEYLVSHNIEL